MRELRVVELVNGGIDKGGSEFGVELQVPEEAFALPWANFVTRYLQPALSMVKHRDCKSAVKCALSEGDW